MSETKAILYDLDGVLVDACDIHFEAFNKALMLRCGFKISRREHDAVFNGLPTKEKLKLLNDQGRVPEEMFNDITKDKQTLTWVELKKLTEDTDKVVLHKSAKAAGYRLGCVTNSIRISAEQMLRNTGQYEFMDILISNEDIAHPKPCSEGYITAMVRLGVEPSEVLIVEDSPKGLESARATGARVWQVSNATEVTWERFKTVCLF